MICSLMMQCKILLYIYDTKINSETKIRWLKRKQALRFYIGCALNINCTLERALPTYLERAYNHKNSESHLTKLSKEAK